MQLVPGYLVGDDHAYRGQRVTVEAPKGRHQVLLRCLSTAAGGDGAHKLTADDMRH